MKHIFQHIEKQSIVSLKLPESLKLSGSSALVIIACCFLSPRLMAQTFPSPGISLPNGKTIVITYEVDVNANACPTGTVPSGDISNQSNVSGGNFSTVQTDEPSNPASNPSPTLTPFAALTIGNLVYNDINRDGDYDMGTDAGLDNVAVNLYLDDGNGVLDSGDGSPIANTTTAGGGLYAFTVCPGNYIVEVAASNFTSGGALYNSGAPYVSSPLVSASDPDLDLDDNDDNGNPVNGFGVASQAITMAYGTEPDGCRYEHQQPPRFGFQNTDYSHHQ
jgi:hypothetical protein